LRLFSRFLERFPETGMDSFEVNKILGAVLGTLTFTLALVIGSDILFSAHAPEKPGYELPSPAEDAGVGGAGAPAAAAVEPIATRLAVADPAKGEALTKQCLSCHTFEKGGPNKVGPNLYGVIGNHHAHLENFGYSAAMKAKVGEQWTFEAIDHFLENPQGAVPKTAMNYPGLKKPDARANLIAWLNQNSDSPLPLPPPPAPGDAAAPPAEAPAGGAPAAPPAPAKAH
jgi:cytochrome c